MALTAILKHSGPSDVRDWFTRCSTVQIEVWSLCDRMVTTHIIEECGWDQEYEKEKPYERVRFMYTKNLSPQGHDIAPV